MELTATAAFRSADRLYHPAPSEGLPAWTACAAAALPPTHWAATSTDWTQGTNPPTPAQQGRKALLEHLTSPKESEIK